MAVYLYVRSPTPVPGKGHTGNVGSVYNSAVITGVAIMSRFLNRSGWTRPPTLDAQREISLDEVARKAGISKAELKRWESGKSAPTIIQVHVLALALAEAWGISFEEVIKLLFTPPKTGID
jgi:DNA-binding XRE family transcriptional regulator